MFCRQFFSRARVELAHKQLVGRGVASGNVPNVLIAITCKRSDPASLGVFYIGAVWKRSGHGLGPPKVHQRRSMLPEATNL